MVTKPRPLFYILIMTVDSILFQWCASRTAASRESTGQWTAQDGSPATILTRLSSAWKVGRFDLTMNLKIWFECRKSHWNYFFLFRRIEKSFRISSSLEASAVKSFQKDALGWLLHFQSYGGLFDIKPKSEVQFHRRAKFSTSMHGCQMAIAKFLNCMCLALRAWRTMAPLHYAAKFWSLPFLRLRSRSNFAMWQHCLCERDFTPTS